MYNTYRYMHVHAIHTIQTIHTDTYRYIHIHTYTYHTYRYMLINIIYIHVHTHTTFYQCIYVCMLYVLYSINMYVNCMCMYMQVFACVCMYVFLDFESLR
jgi:hypothetical protein